MWSTHLSLYLNNLVKIGSERDNTCHIWVQVHSECDTHLIQLGKDLNALINQKCNEVILTLKSKSLASTQMDHYYVCSIQFLLIRNLVLHFYIVEECRKYHITAIKNGKQLNHLWVLPCLNCIRIIQLKRLDFIK